MLSGEAGFPIEACLVPLALVATIAAMYFIARYLQGRAEAELERMRGDARRFDSTRRELESTVQDFKDDTQEPFYSRVSDLRRQLDGIDRQSAHMQQERVRLKQQTNNLRTSFWRAMMGAPYQWIILQREVGGLRAEMQAAWQALTAAGEKEQEIRRIGWEIAQEARRVQHLEQETRQILDGLHSNNLHGDAFDAALAQEQALRLSLEKIPNYFFSGDEENLLAQVDRDAIVFAHTTVENLRPELETLSAQAADWKAAYSRAVESGGLLRRALDDLGVTLDNLPPNIQSDDARTRYRALRQIGATLQNTLAHAEVAGLDELHAEAGRQARLVQEASQTLKRARREAAALETLLSELPPAFKDLSLELAMLGAKSVHPVAWRSSVDTLTELNRGAKALGAAGDVRAPEQIVEGMKNAIDLRARQKALAEHIRKVGETHTELARLLTSAEFAQLEEWLESAVIRIEKIAAYAPENWPRAVGVERLPGEVKALAEARRKLSIDKPAEALPEDQAAERLSGVRRFAEEYTALRQRANTARLRLDELTAAETAARERIQAAAAALGQIDFIVDSNEFLGGIAAQDIERFSAEVKRLDTELDERRRGSVDLKAKQIESLVERIEAALNSRLDQLLRENRQTGEELSGLLRELDEIASLEEQPVVEARRLLSSGAGASAASTRANFALADLVPEFKRRSDYWQSCNAAVRALEDFHPLIETYREAVFHRDQAHEALGGAASQIRRKRAWPPTTVTFEAETQELEKIDAQMQELRDSRARAIARTAQLGGLAARYQSLADRVAQSAERAAREQTDVEEIEAQINELAELWRNHLHQYDSYPEAGAEIKALLEDIHTLLARIRRQYIQGGADYEATLQSIKNLNKRVRYYQVALDDESALDVQGNVHRRRESRRV